MTPTHIYVTINHAAHITARPHRTIRTWAAHGHIRSAHHRGALVVNALDALRESATRNRRSRLPKPPPIP